MKRILILLFAVTMHVHLLAQDKVNLNFAQVFSGFKFKDSDGLKDESLSKDIRYSYALNYEKLLGMGIYIKPEIGYKNFGAKSDYDNIDIVWNFHYLDLNLGGGYIFNPFRLKPYGGVALYYSYMYKGDQKVGAAVYDILAMKTISKHDIGFCLDLGLRYDFSETSGVFIEFRNSFGLKQMDNNLEGGSRELYNRAHSVRFGLSFSVLNGK